jgi:hypothetical protein
MKKLIKISIDHYVIIDDAEEIKDNDFILLYVENYIRQKYEIGLEPNKQFTKPDFVNDRIVQVIRKFDTGVETTDGKYWLNTCKKITHSTEPLDKDIHEFAYWTKDIIPLPLSEIQELVDGYSAEKMAENHWKMQYVMALDESTKPVSYTHLRAHET